MKNLLTLALLSFTTLIVFAQDKTTVTASSSEISDNLDLKAIATIFGESENLEDFEKRINDPKAQISNLDLNDDNFVDYLRVVESVENNDHIIVIQSVLEKDMYQDIATIEIQKDRSTNRVQVQVVGDVFMYGQNYIYEPIYVHTPIIYNTFWAPNYLPYYSNWYWNYYPTYFNYWSPFPVFRYRNHINVFIGRYGHTFNYVTYRNCGVSYNNYYGRRANAFETRYPNRSFSNRNVSVSNRYELDRTRSNRTINTRDRVTQTRNQANTRTNRNSRENSVANSRDLNTTRNNNGTRNQNLETTRVKNNRTEQNETIRPTRGNSSNTINTNRTNGTNGTTRNSSTTRSTSENVPSRNTNVTKNNAPSRATTSPSTRANAANNSNSRAGSTRGER